MFGKKQGTLEKYLLFLAMQQQIRLFRFTVVMAKEPRKLLLWPLSKDNAPNYASVNAPLKPE
jgi:hypothetical protein